MTSGLVSKLQFTIVGPSVRLPIYPKGTFLLTGHDMFGGDTRPPNGGELRQQGASLWRDLALGRQA